MSFLKGQTELSVISRCLSSGGVWCISVAVIKCQCSKPLENYFSVRFACFRVNKGYYCTHSSQIENMLKIRINF